MGPSRAEDWRRYYPWPKPRPGHEEAVKALIGLLSQGKSAVLAAPNGFGKTAVALAAALTVAKGRVFWATRTLREAEHVKRHCDFIGVEAAVVKGRAEVCPALPEPMTPEEASAYCHTIKLRCQYYANYLSDREPACPYYAQFSEVKDAKVVIGTYNMLLLGRGLTPLPPVRDGDVLVVDEAHNVVAVTEEHGFTKGSVERAIQELSIVGGPPALRKFLEELLTGLEDFEPNTRAAILAESLVYYGRQFRRLLAERGQRPRSSLHAVGRALREACLGSPYRVEEGRFTVVTVKEPDLPRAPTVFLSGTISQWEAKLLNAEHLDFTALADYEASTIIVEDLTSAYDRRAPEMFKRYVELLGRLKGPSIAFAASYKVLQGILEAGPELEQRAFIERPDMRSREAEELAEAWRATVRQGKTALYLGVCGGRASEGVDFDEAECVAILGVPFPEPDDPSLEALRSYYEQRFACDVEAREPERLAELYSMILPAMRRVAQAVGRAFRSPGKKATVILADERFKRLRKLLPKWVVRDAKTLKLEELPSALKG